MKKHYRFQFFLLLIPAVFFIFSCTNPVVEDIHTNARTVGTGEERLGKVECENMTTGGSYTGIISSPFDGAALNGSSDFISTDVVIPTIPGQYRLEVFGASSTGTTAEVSVYLDDSPLGTLHFDTQNGSVASVVFSVESGSPGVRTLKLTAEKDNGSWDAYLDHLELIFTGTPPENPEAPVVSTVPLFESREYRNMFAEWGKTEAEVDAKIDDMVGKFFYGEDGGGWQIYKEVGSDMAYIHTVDTNDVRSEGMSYGMMICVQLDMQEEFDKLWNWTKTYMQHQDGDRKGYFAWQVGTNGNVIDQNPAPDGEEYFALALFFAANRWGNGTGIYDYEAEANEILDDMIRHKQKRQLPYWNGNAENLIDDDAKQIVLSAIGNSATYTDPSYHLPHFYKLFQIMADPDLIALWEAGEEEVGNIGARGGISWSEIANVSRQLLQNAAHDTTGLAPAYSDFDGTPNASNPGVKSDKFSYDSWRVAMNIALDYLWFMEDSWQKETWVNNYLGFFHDEGVSSHGNLYELNGNRISSDHSPGLVAMNAVAATMYENENAWDFIEELWNTTPTEGQYRYYDGCLYLFGMLHVSGRYRIYAEGTVIEPPAAPGELSANAVSSSKIELSWNDYADNERGFIVERSTDNLNWTEMATTSSNATTYIDSSLDAETQYIYRVKAYNSAGNSAFSASANATTEAVPRIAPEAPSALNASAASSSEMNLSWADNSESEEGFIIEQSQDNVSWSLIADLAADTESYAVSDLDETTKYFFRVKAYNIYGDSDYSASADAITFGASVAIQAEDFDTCYYNLPVQNGYVYNIGYSHWLEYDDRDLNGSTFTFRYSKESNGGYMEVRLDNNDSGSAIAKIYPDATGSWETWAEATVDISAVSGTHDIYLYFHNSSNNLRLDWFSIGGNGEQEPVLSDNTDLAYLGLSAGTLSPAFNTDITSYTAEVANSVESLTVSATAEDGNASVSGTGIKNLAAGVNTFIVRVTAEDGETVKEYSLSITRLGSQDDIQDPFSKMEAESFQDSSNVTVISDGAEGQIVRFQGGSNSWIAFEVDFDQAPAGIDIRVKDSASGGTVKFNLDAPDGPNFCTLYPNGYSSWHNKSNSTWPRPTGVHTVYITASTSTIELNWFQCNK